MTTQNTSTLQQQEDQFARSLVAHLSGTVDDLPHDITERLKVARVQALGKRKLINAQTAGGVSVSGSVATLHSRSGHPKFWNWMGSILPLAVLVVGLITISVIQDDLRASEIAQVDAELLTDVLPPSAYTDPGFAAFLRSGEKE
jgi:Protein of unknown function (DUF3619)